jgi:hypothetical protein
MKATILITITDGQVRCHLNCGTYEAQEALEPILLEIRRVVGQALESVEADELVVSTIN